MRFRRSYRRPHKSRFVEMFGDEKRFPAVTVGDVFTVKGPKRIHKEEWTSEGVPFYRVSNLSDLLEGRETTSDNFISRSRFEELKADEQVPAAGDVLVTARGTLGRCYVVKPHDEFYFQDGMITWLADRNERITLPYFLQAVQSQTFKRQYEGKSSGTTVAVVRHNGGLHDNWAVGKIQVASPAPRPPARVRGVRGEGRQIGVCR